MYFARTFFLIYSWELEVNLETWNRTSVGQQCITTRPRYAVVVSTGGREIWRRRKKYFKFFFNVKATGGREEQ